MTICNHTHLLKTTLNHGTWEKDIYRCENEKCRQLLSGKLEPAEIKVTVPAEGEKGKP